MLEHDVTTILVAIARVEGRLDALSSAESRTSERLDGHSRRLDKVERFAYVAVGMALASGLPQLLALVTG